ncbi:MAG: hypothetical protein HKP61_10245 [Dactylosporangium sp.]|nr:hypothetical protein [Dactylosporangium sp.]NNJ61311.1 hypothetical protein [Dactylosporangium sp.]
MSLSRSRYVTALSATALIAGSAIGVGGVALASYVTSDEAPPNAVRAASMPQGNDPTAVVSGASVTLTWDENQLLDQSVTGYLLTRYQADGTDPRPAGGGCASVVQALTCTETDVPDGTWLYGLRPVRGMHWTGAENPHRLPVTVSTIGVTFPVANRSYGPSDYGPGCGVGYPQSLCGTATASPGRSIDNVEVSVRQVATDKYYSTGAFTSGTERRHRASGTADWHFALPTTEYGVAGQYVIHAVATDDAGRTSETSVTFSVYPQNPAAPALTSGPPAYTKQADATFAFTTSEADSTTLCSLDGAAYARCTSPASFDNLTADTSHTFRVVAEDPGGNTSIATEAGWTIDTAAPQAADIQARNDSGGAPGTLETSDTLTLDFSEPIAPASILAGWDGDARSIAVRIEDGVAGAPDTLSLQTDGSAPLAALGSVALPNGSYVTASIVLPGTLKVAGSRVIVTFGTPTNSAAVQTAAEPGAMVWTPGDSTARVTDRAGNPLGNPGPATVTETTPGTTSPDVEF